VADFSFFRKKEEPKEVKKTPRTVRLQPQYKRQFEEICEAESVKFDMKFVDGAYEFYISESDFPRVEKYLAPPKKEESQDDFYDEEVPKEPKEEKKISLNDQIGGAQGKAGGNYKPAPPTRQTPQSGVGSRPVSPPKQTPTPSRSEPQRSQNQTQTTPKISSQTPPYTPPQNDFVRNVEAAARGELPPRTAPKNPPKVATKDLTKDFGVLTLEEQKRLDERQAKAAAEKKPPKKRVKTGRDNQVKTRLTDTEMKLFSERVKSSGMKQGEFMRECLLHEAVNVRSLTDIDAQAFGKLMEMSSDLGRIGGLVKGTVMANKDEFAVLSPAEKDNLEALIRELNKVKEDLLKVVQNLYGDS